MNIHFVMGFPSGPDGKESACNAGDLGQEDPLEKGMTTHSGILAWRIPWTEEPVRLQDIGSQRLKLLRMHACVYMPIPNSSIPPPTLPP